jgi:putative phosphoribosyl transferase
MLGVIHNEVIMPLDGGIQLAGTLDVPPLAKGIVLFAHGSGSSRFSPRNQFVARMLQEKNLATLLFDLLTPEESEIDQYTAQLRFDIDLLAERLIAAVDWLDNSAATSHLQIGLFGASTGAAGALIAAAMRPEHVLAVVSRGGRPDLADKVLPKVQAPTLLIVGGNDIPVIGMNQQVKARMRATCELQIVPAAGHLFEEPGALEQVAHLAGNWFKAYLEI